MTQETLAELTHFDQSRVSRYERTKIIDEAILEKFANALNVSINVLKETEEETPMVIVQNNSFSNSGGIALGEGDLTNIVNTLDKFTEEILEKVTELTQKNKELVDISKEMMSQNTELTIRVSEIVNKNAELYERLLQKEQEMNRLKEELQQQEKNTKQ